MEMVDWGQNLAKIPNPPFFEGDISGVFLLFRANFGGAEEPLEFAPQTFANSASKNASPRFGQKMAKKWPKSHIRHLSKARSPVFLNRFAEILVGRTPDCCRGSAQHKNAGIHPRILSNFRLQKRHFEIWPKIEIWPKNSISPSGPFF